MAKSVSATPANAAVGGQPAKPVRSRAAKAAKTAPAVTEPAAGTEPAVQAGGGRAARSAAGTAARGAPGKPAATKAAPAKPAQPRRTPAKTTGRAAATKAGAAAGAAVKPAAGSDTVHDRGTSAPAEIPLAAKKTTARKASAVTKTSSPPVPAGTDWSTGELAEVRAELEAQLAELRAEYDHAIAELNDMQNYSRDGAGDDQADTGTKTFEREQELSIAHNRLDLLTQVEHAIDRISSGTYGICEGCGKPIAKARLQAFPSATLCVECKQREERR
jgi:RNA polymerase-binding protein DksA